MEQLNTLRYLKLILKNKKQIAISTIAACILSLIAVSPLFIKPLYESVAIVYPTNLTPFANESNTEQLIQFFNSQQIEKIIVDKYDLYTRYNLAKEEKGALTKLSKAYKKHIQFTRTNFEAIELTVLDEDPKTAQLIANDLLKNANEFIKESKLKPVSEYIKGYEYQIKLLEIKLDSITNQIAEMSIKFGIIDVKNQSKQLSKGNLNIDEKQLLNNLKQHGAEFDLLKKQQQVELKNYKELKEQVNKQLTDINSNLSYFTIVSSPTLSDETAYPNRIFISFIFTFSTFLLSLFLIILKYEYKKQNA
jgi:capsule polysaccharide export protein KpsE/RkpR